ncbi:MAG: DNA mismatch repair endonuclease MutL [Thermaerobacter sp.]|nr:DNA mismatch repair endonuclease MutL [Thermaerobacter sp.]
MPIRELSPEVINQIAAGEVVERPASVVKELVENSLDAGAQRIVVRIAEGGIGRIEVMDDGRGMAQDELALALRRHATSKLWTLDDLQNLPSYGFRGEALPAIAAVSSLRITSRASGSDTAFTYTAGDERPAPAAMASGTRITVDGLFSAIPARRKFMLAPEAEARRVAGVLERLALAAPGVSLLLEVEGREVMRTGGSGNLLETFADLFGREISETLEPVSFKGPGGEVHGLTSRPGRDRGNRQLQFWIVGGRPVMPGSLRFAAEAAYQGRLLKGRYPILCLRVEVPPGDVDVNVHPAKLEVRFRREREVAGLVRAAVGEAIGARVQPMTQGEIGTQSPSPMAAPLFFGEGRIPYADVGFPASETAAATASADAPPPGGLPRGAAPRPIGQSHGLFLLAEDSEALYLFDQHAAHERIGYERLAETAERSAQLLLSPVVLRLGPEQAAALAQSGPSLAEYGFLVEPFGARDALVRSVPRIFGKAADAKVLLDLLDGLGVERENPVEHLERVRREIAACRASVKANDRLSLMEQAALIEQLWRCEEPRFCPHGRPTFLRFGADELRARFGRR